MTDSHETIAPADRDWPFRPLFLALGGLAAGLLVHLIIGVTPDYQLSTTKLSLLAFVIVTAGLIGFTIERRLWWTSLVFAAATGLIAAGVVWWSGGPDAWSGGDGWRGVSLLLAIAIAAPLYQAARDEAGMRFPYRSVHDHAWTNVVLWGACCVFVGITLALTYLLAGLFDLIKLSFLSDLLRKEWFWRALIGLAFGSALGLLREQTQVVRLLQRVVLTVLAVLAPVLAVGLIVFVLALPFTGLAPLWDAGSATGILLACIMGSLILANSVIGNAPEEERRGPLLRYGAMGLGLVMLPLGAIAAIAIGLRIGQYGFTPERLWALTFVILACAFGVAYLVALLLGRLEWAARVRPANLNLAFATCAVALLLATPLVSFNAIATKDQVGRLESGRTAPGKFDWRALAFDFGEPGKAALKKLQASANAAIRERAVTAANTVNRYEVSDGIDETNAENLDTSLRILPAGGVLPADLRKMIAARYICGRDHQRCTLTFLSAAREAILLQESCFVRPVAQSTPATTDAESVMPVVESVPDCRPGEVGRFAIDKGQWSYASGGDFSPGDEASKLKMAQGYKAGDIGVRTVERRQLVVGGVPVGDSFE